MIVLLTTTYVYAQSNNYQLALVGWGSSTTTNGGSYQMVVTIGQPEAEEISGGSYTINGGVGGGKRVVIAVTPFPTATPIPAPAETPVPMEKANTLYLPLVTR